MNSIYFFIVTFIASVAISQTSTELTCRAKAKEVAVQTYSDCVVTTKNSQIDSVRADYQAEVAALKAKYDSKLKKISGNSVAPQKKSQASTLNVSATPIPVKGIAKELPKKSGSASNFNTQDVSEEKAVIPMQNYKAETSDFESNSSDMEVVDMPVE